MSDLSNRFSRRGNDNLLQLWRGRDALDDSDIDPLRDELERRGLSKELEEICNQPASKDIYGDLPRGPQTYLNLSVPFWWIREIWLRIKTRNGIQLDAVVDNARRTRPPSRSAARAELLYSYEYQGQQYSGRTVRDFVFDTAAANSLAYDFHQGEKLPIIIDRQDPAISYFPSGFGLFEPIVVGFQALFAWAVVIALIRLLVSLTMRKA